MTVKELKDILDNFSDAMEVCIPTIVSHPLARIHDMASVDTVECVKVDDYTVVVLLDNND